MSKFLPQMSKILPPMSKFLDIQRLFSDFFMNHEKRLLMII